MFVFILDSYDSVLRCPSISAEEVGVVDIPVQPHLHRIWKMTASARQAVWCASIKVELTAVRPILSDIWAL
jgi:hypothetical protein